MRIFATKLGRLIIYTFKGNHDYAFGQFSFTLFLQNFFLHLLNSTRGQKNNKAVVFDLQTGAERYSFNLINTYKLADFDIYLKINYSFYAGLKGLYSKEIFSFLKPSIFLNYRLLGNYKQVNLVTDKKIISGGFDYDKVLVINYSEAFKEMTLKVPFGFHPLVYIENKIKSQHDLQFFLRKINSQNFNNKIVFGGGSLKHEMYNMLDESFPSIINRNRLNQLLFSNFGSVIATSTDNFPDKSILALNPKYRVKHGQWMETINKCNFFIAPPGFEMPFCHNLYEAMACGLIPILQYNTILSPTLHNNINCLHYRSENEFVDVVQNALEMNTEEISKMRKEVFKYFENYVIPHCFLENLIFQNKLPLNISCIAGPYSLKSH